MSSEPQPRSVCIRVPNWVGDVVMATPLLRTVRQRLPQADVAVVARAKVEPILRNLPWFDQLITYRPVHRWPAREFLRCAGLIRQSRYDLGMLLPNSFSSALMFRIGTVKRRVGYVRDMRGFLLTDPLPRPKENGRFVPTYMVDYYLALCSAVDIDPASRDMALRWSPQDARRAHAILRGQGLRRERHLALLHPGAGYGPSKRWVNERWAALADRLIDVLDMNVALIGGPAERDIIRDIRMRSRHNVADLSACGIDLNLLKCVVAESELLVTTDSGPRHYGVALGVPTVCLMGPTHPGYSTSGRPHDIVLRVDVECGPCQRKTCPRDHRCMREITVEMALTACRAALTPSVETRPDD